MQNEIFTRRGVLFVIAAPAGSGKTTLCRKLLAAHPELSFSVSCTTRPPRPGEVEGRDYYFLSLDEFQRRLENDEFLETAPVHGNWYGTLKATVEAGLGAGRDLLLDIDVEGATQIRSCQDGAIAASVADVFIMPPALSVLETRLRQRGEGEEQIKTRLITATRELPHWRDFKYTIISGTPEEDFRRFEAILLAEQCVTRRLARAQGRH